MPLKHRSFVLLAALLSSTLSPRPLAAQGEADIKKQCAAAYVDAQKLKKQGALVAARENLITCGRDECTTAIKNECAAWLTEVNASIPTVVIVAKDASGEETLDVKLYVDDELVRESLDAKAIEIDPGKHRFRFELAGHDPIEREVVLQEGRKNKQIEVSWQADAPPPPLEEPAADPGPEPAAPQSEPPILAYVLGGVGIVALAGAGYFWLSAEGEKSDLDACKPVCNQDDVDSVEQKRLFGDIALGVGVVSLGAATYLLLTRPKAPPPAESARAPRFDLEARPGGAFASVRGQF